MIAAELFARADGLRTARVPFVLATVVRAQRPTSARPGDRAIVLADGTVEGFVGGACAMSTLRAQSARLLGTGTAATTLLRILPEPEPGAGDDTGVTVVDNPCLSGGAVEIFLEAVVPSTLVYVFGEAPIARALVAVGAAAGYDLRAGTDPADPVPEGAAAVVVAAHGHDELPVLRAALAAAVPYVALVASPKRGEAVLAELATATGDAGRVKTPAGLDIGARTPGEVAISILAELIMRRAAGGGAATHDQEPANVAGTAVDPVCGMTVAVAPATLQYVHAGRTWHFCAPGCRNAFAGDPARYDG